MSLAFSSERERELEKAARVACEFEWNCSKGHYKLPVWFHGLEKALSAYTTKDTPMTDDPKVKELIEAAKALRNKDSRGWILLGSSVNIDSEALAKIKHTEARLDVALAAFDPPMPNPSMPEWDKLTAPQMRAISEAYTKAFNMDRGDEKTFYANVRNALATAKD